ncbi:MAG TPA: SPW repeat protein [Ktedonosporobacter sp.]|nr:SPW repeat protein [Ktedonosporobacter sp.]
MKTWTRWQDWASLVLGVILFITPWVFSTIANGAATYDAWIIGIVTVLLALWALAMLGTASIAQWILVIAGVWLFISPWVLGYSRLTGESWAAWIIGLLLVIVNGFTLYQTRSAGTRVTA